jgi:hypothetical protein
MSDESMMEDAWMIAQIVSFAAVLGITVGALIEWALLRFKSGTKRHGSRYVTKRKSQ